MQIVVMGVSGSGKTSVGQALARAIHGEFQDADELHSAENIAKMSAGVALTDADRQPWLELVGEFLAQHQDAVVACSALKLAYRDKLRTYAPGAIFVHLAAPQAVIAERVRARSATTNHFAGTELLTTQYRDLEQLTLNEVGITIDVTELSEAEVVSAAFNAVIAIDARN